MYNVDIISKNAVYYLPVDRIMPNPYDPRKSLGDIKALVSSVKQYGLIEPIVVRKIGRGYELVSGHRRLRAVKQAGFDEIPSIIVEVNDRDSAVISVLENEQRLSLNSFERADALRNIMNDFGHSSLELGQLLCTSHNDIMDKMKLLTLNNNIKKSILENNIEFCADTLCQLDNEENQLEAIDKIKSRGLGKKGAVKVVEEIKNGKEPKTKVKKCFKDIRLFINTIKQVVDIMCQSGKQTSYTVEHSERGYEIKILVQE